MAPLRILSRSSPLAQRQVAEVMALLPDINWQLTTLQSFGDRHREVSLMSEIQPDFFTDEIDNALLENKGDIAVHSAKDVPFPLREGLDIIALTRNLDPTDSLVSRSGMPLEKLPANARVGTSSVLRKESLLAIRSDLQIVSIRGNIEERIAQVDNGSIDAVIVATCALKRLGLENRIAHVLPFATHPLQGSLAVVSRVGCPELRVLFSRIDMRVKFGKVWLVGAGPGDPDLLTIRADKVLSRADVIFHDDLLDSSLLYRYSARKVYVGKRKGQHSLAQAEINEMLYRSAIEGNETVRLKGGDPLLFSRGGEELYYLQERLVAVEVVPGLSAVQVCAASTRIPLTNRGESRSLGIASGHYAKGEEPPAMKTDTAVYYMAASKLTEIRQALRQSGHGEKMPVVVVRHGGLAQEESMKTTLEQLSSIELPSPVTVIAGSVGKHYRPLERILYTGIDPKDFRHPGHVVHYPLIEIVPLPFDAPDPADFDTILFTSKNGVKYFLDSTGPMDKRVLAIGQGTARAVEKFRMRVDHLPTEPNSDALVPLVEEHSEWRILYPCSGISRNRLHDFPQVTSLSVYTTKVCKREPLDLTHFSTIVFTSPSTVDAFVQIFGNIPPHLVCAAFGPFTRDRLLRCPISPGRIELRGPALSTVDGGV